MQIFEICLILFVSACLLPLIQKWRSILINGLIKSILYVEIIYISWNLSIACSHAAVHRMAASNQLSKFIIVPEKLSQSSGFGMVMICPSHAHGTPDEAIVQLRLILKHYDGEQPATIWICRADQAATLQRFAPMIRRVIINPFVLQKYNIPRQRNWLWIGQKHPLLNQLRRIRMYGANTQLLACINLTGEPSLFEKRSSSLEELQWQIFAVCGAQFQGMVWRGNLADSDQSRFLARLSYNLTHRAAELASAIPIRWASEAQSQPLSALKTGTKLFVVLLNPKYMKLEKEDGHTVILPLDNSMQKDEILLTPPAGLKILSGTTLDGRPVALQKSGHQIKVNYSFRGGGDMLIFNLSGHATEDIEPESSSTQPTTRSPMEGPGEGSHSSDDTVPSHKDSSQ